MSGFPPGFEHDTVIPITNITARSREISFFNFFGSFLDLIMVIFIAFPFEGKVSAEPTDEV